MITDLNRVAKRAARLMRLGGTPAMKVQARSRGKAYPREGYFAIPAWATNRHPAFAVAYVIHELAHFAKSWSGWTMRGHGPQMRKVEAEAAEAFGLRLVWRGTAYLAQIRHLESGRILCDGYGNPWINESEYQDPACLI